MGEIRIVGPDKTREYPYPVCKKKFYNTVFWNFLQSAIVKFFNIREMSRSYFSFQIVPIYIIDHYTDLQYIKH